MDKFGLTNEQFQTINNNLPELRRIEIPGIKYAVRTIHPSIPGLKNEVLEAYNNALIEDILKHI